jgi:hypothetical protein
MSKNFLVKLAIIILAAVAVFFHFVGQPSPPIKVTPEVEERVEEAKPALSADEDAYLTLLAESVIAGGPPKDGIPSIDNPKYTSAAEGDEWLLANDAVFGVDYKGVCGGLSAKNSCLARNCQ